MIPTRRLAPSLRSFFLGLPLAAAWGTVLFLVLELATRMGHGLAFGAQLRRALEIGGVLAGALFLLYQPPLDRAYFGLGRKVPASGIVFLPFWLAYHVAAFPGVLIGRVAGLLRFAPHGSGGAAGSAAAAPPKRGETCPFKGRVVAEEPTAFRGGEWSPGETMFEIKEDWRVVTQKIRYWGFIDRKGDVREGTSPEEDGGKPVVASVRLSGDKPGVYVGTYRLGGFTQQ